MAPPTDTNKDNEPSDPPLEGNEDKVPTGEEDTSMSGSTTGSLGEGTSTRRSARLKQRRDDYREQYEKLKEDFKTQTSELETMRDMYATNYSESNVRLDVMRRQVEELEVTNAELMAEVEDSREAARSKTISLAEVRASESYRILKRDLREEMQARVRQAVDRAVANTQNRADQQVKKVQSKLDETVRRGRDCHKDLQKVVSDLKRENVSLRKQVKAAETFSQKKVEQFSRLKVELSAAVKARKNNEAHIKQLSKSLSFVEKQRMEMKKEIGKVLRSREYKKAEAAVAELEKEKISLEKEKLKSESRIHSKVLAMELDKKKREHLIRARASIQNDLQISREQRQQKAKEDRRSQREIDASSRLSISLNGVRELNRAQRGGDFPLLDSAEAEALNRHTAVPPPSNINTNVVNGIDMTTLVANVMSALTSRGTEHTSEALPPGVDIIRNPSSGAVTYRAPPGLDGTREIVANRDHLFQKQPAAPSLSGQTRPAAAEGSSSRPAVRPRVDTISPFAGVSNSTGNSNVTIDFSGAVEASRNQVTQNYDLDGDHRTTMASLVAPSTPSQNKKGNAKQVSPEDNNAPASK